ncbi:hypothetical protein ATCVNTS1_587R [Acanthocystis turfacea Chlorella virus NTS-1]|nr:hypothetical protein ATCVNTS1_587R [Acanthocystis turfacea Chlorella virus NTS-1]
MDFDYFSEKTATLSEYQHTTRLPALALGIGKQGRYP